MEREKEPVGRLPIDPDGWDNDEFDEDDDPGDDDGSDWDGETDEWIVE